MKVQLDNVSNEVILNLSKNMNPPPEQNPLTTQAKSNNKSILLPIFQLIIIGVIATLVSVGIGINDAIKKRSQSQKNTVEKIDGVSQNSTPQISHKSPYTVVLNPDGKSIDVVLSNGVITNVKNLSKDQQKCVIFGGGLSCVDGSYRPPVYQPPVNNNNNVARSEREPYRKLTRKLSLAELMGREDVWIPIAVTIVVWFLFLRDKK